MAIMRGSEVSDKIVTDNRSKSMETTKPTKSDTLDVPYKGIADKFNYGGKTGKM